MPLIRQEEMPPSGTHLEYKLFFHLVASISFAIVRKETITQFIAIIKSEIVHVGVVSD